MAKTTLRVQISLMDFENILAVLPHSTIYSTYHNLEEDDIHIINKLVQQNNIKNVTSDNIANGIRSLNNGNSADYHGLTIEHTIYAGLIWRNYLLHS